MPHMDATHSTEKEPVCTHLHKRASGYSYRRNIPKDLQTYFGRSVNFEALGTHDRKEACVQCRERGLRDDREFKRVRALLKAQPAATVLDQPAPALTPLLSPSGHSASEPDQLAQAQPRPLTLADVTPAIQAIAEADLEMYRVSGVLNDRTGFALQIEQLPPRFTLEEWTYRILLKLREERQGMEGKEPVDLEIIMARLKGDLDFHERVVLGKARNTQRLMYHEAYRDALRAFLAGDDGKGIAEYEALQREAVGALAAKVERVGSGAVPAVASSSPKLSEVIDHFLSRQDKLAPMYKKYEPVLSWFLELLGDRPVSALKQADIDGFFKTLCRLPPRWPDEKRKRDLSMAELAALAWPKVISPKTFDASYIGAFRPFLKESRRMFADQGFPFNLTTDGIRYSGNVDEGENKQRAFSLLELKRLFEGDEMQGYASTPGQEHCYWLPLIGLYTGARVNEICQLNPHADIAEEGGIWFFSINEKDDGDNPLIRKSVKNKSSIRKVPIHPKLLDLGLLSYVDAVKREGGTLLFPKWKPSKSRASANAEKWFRRLLEDMGLRDETPGSRLVGFHSFRHTFLNHALNNEITNAEWITGHVSEGVSAVVRGYQGVVGLEKKLELVRMFAFDVEPPVIKKLRLEFDLSFREEA